MNRPRPIRILHVISEMTRGGIETWLMHLLRHIDRDRFQMDFLVQTTREAYYDKEIMALGGRILPCLEPRRPWVYAANFRHILAENEAYDVIHSHVHYHNGYVLRLAAKAGIPMRISHSHTTRGSDRQFNRINTLKRAGYAALMERWIKRYSTVGLACSELAATALFGPDWQKDPRWQLLYYGIDLNLFQKTENSNQLRNSLGLAEDAFVIGHVGRMTEQKNHMFLLDITAEIVKREPKARLLLLGEGHLRPAIEQKAAQLGLCEKIIFAGSRPDVPKLMLNVMDTFLFPSLYEGLPVVSLEAQAAGLPSIISDTITRECIVIPELVRQLPLDKSAAGWAEVLLEARQVRSKIKPDQAFARVENTSFNIERSVNHLQQIYAGSLHQN